MQSVPPSDNEADRLTELQAYSVLGIDPEVEIDETTVAATTCDMPIALMGLIDLHWPWLKSPHRLDVSKTPSELAFLRACRPARKATGGAQFVAGFVLS